MVGGSVVEESPSGQNHEDRELVVDEVLHVECASLEQWVGEIGEVVDSILP